MDLRQLRYFVGIVQAGSLSRAADQLHVAQSAISRHLGMLEAELGRELATRGPKGILLTEAGNVLYRHAEAILRHIEFARRETMSALTVPSGRVSIGFPVSMANILGYELFVRMRGSYPQILLHVTDANSSLLHERLVNGRLDVALLFIDQPQRGLAIEPLLHEELFYAGADPDTSPVRIAEVAQRPLLLAGPGSALQRAVSDAFRKQGLTVPSIGEIDTLSTLRRTVASGLGNTILSWAALYEDDDRIALNYRRFADAKLIRPLAMCFSEVAQRTPAIEAAASTLKSLIHDLVKNGTWQGVSLIDAPAELSHSLVPQ